MAQLPSTFLSTGNEVNNFEQIKTVLNGGVDGTNVAASSTFTTPNIGVASGTQLAVTGNLVTTGGTIQYMGSAGGTADVLTLTPTIALTAYATGMFVLFKATAANATTTPTVAISGLAAKTFVKRAATALAAGDIPNGAMIFAVYDGTNFEVLNPIVN